MVNGVYSMNTLRGKRMRMIGMQQLQANIKRLEKNVAFASMAGLIKVGNYIEEDMHKTPPTIPKDTGDMGERYRTVPIPNPDYRKNAVRLGWANTGKDEYAPYVHEMTTPPYESVDWNVEGSGPKFFETAIKRNMANGKIMSILRKNIISQTGI
jgi:hypothetical protein